MAEAPLIVVDHPAVAHRLARLRDRHTESDEFRRLAGEIAGFVAYEALRDLRTSAVTVVTPVGAAEARQIDEPVVVVPIMRAGLGMVPAIQSLVPRTEVAHLGIRRNEHTLLPTTYLDGLPTTLAGRRAVVCDPMLATGGSLIGGCDLVVHRGATEVTALCILASAQGIVRFRARHPGVKLACAAVDPELDHRGFIVPGLGDAGDRMFGLPPDLPVPGSEPVG